jgi:hypothetical protein
MRKKISQRNARRYQKELEAMKVRDYARARQWQSDYPGGVHLGAEQFSHENHVCVDTAQKLGYYLIVKVDRNDYVQLYAVKP